MRAKYSHGVWERFANHSEGFKFAEIHLHLLDLSWNCFIVGYIRFLLYLEQSARGKMTVLTVGSYHDSGDNKQVSWKHVTKKRMRADSQLFNCLYN